MSSSNVSEVLPDGWAQCCIGQVTLPTMKINQKDDGDREVQYIDISSIDNSRNIIGSTKRLRLRHAPSRARQIVRLGDTLFSTVRPYLRNIALVTSCYDQEIASTGFSVLRPAKGVCPEFLFYKTISRDFIDNVARLQYGVSYPAVKDEQVRDQEIWLPPTDEQCRIAARIDELFSEIEAGIESLKKARSRLATYRQAVLKHAFEGKLTARWRKDNADKLETPDYLLDRVRQERAASYEQQLWEWETAVEAWVKEGKFGRKPVKPRIPDGTRKRKPDSIIGQVDLPVGWTWADVGSMFDVVTGGTPKGLDHAKGSDIPFYKVGDMNTPGNEVRMRTATISLSEEERARLGLKKFPEGTIIFPKRGGAILTNKKRILSVSSCFDLNMMGVINRCRSISNEYLWLWFQTLDLKHIYDGSNVPQINNRNVEPLRFPVCGEMEQNEIVRIIGNTFSIADRAVADIDAQLKNGQALRQAILKRAFMGQLVPQDPSDEPASILMERIRAERDETAKRRSPRKTRKRRTTKATA